MAGVRDTGEAVAVLEDDELMETPEEELGEEDDEGLDANERDRVTLAELTAGCDPDDPIDVPEAAELAAVAMRQIELIAVRHGRIEETLDGFNFSFDWSEDADGHVEQQTALQLLAEAGELLDELRRGVFRWLRCVTRGPVMQFDDETTAAARKIAQLWGFARHWAINDAAAASIQYVAACPEALEAIKAAEDRRVELYDARTRRLAARAETALKSTPADADAKPEPNPNDGQPEPGVADDVADLEGLPMSVQLYCEIESSVGIDLDIPTIVADCDRGRIRRELAELAARFSSRYHAQQLGYSVAVIPTDDEKKNGPTSAGDAEPGREINGSEEMVSKGIEDGNGCAANCGAESLAAAVR